MAAGNGQGEKVYLPIFITSVVMVGASLYWFSYEIFEGAGLTHIVADDFFVKVNKLRVFRNEYILKLWAAFLVLMTTIIRDGKGTKMEWRRIITITLIGAVIYLLPWIGSGFFIITTVTGYLILITGFALIGRKIHSPKQKLNDIYETFEQCGELIETPYSINLKTEYQWKHKKRTGYINIVNPFRSLIVCGTPGSGKSYTLYYAAIEQMIKKGFTLFVYDYKFPDLTSIVYNKFLQQYPHRRVELKDIDKTTQMRYRLEPPEGAPQFCVLNFDDPRYSMRCNPLDARYLTDMSDAHEVADLIMKNVNKGQRKEDFFSDSAKVYVAALVWYLKRYKGGIYCSFPHLIELMGMDYKIVLNILNQDEEIRVMIQPFADALTGNAMEQLQGQIASARIPLLKFPSPSLYWSLTGDDFSLDINNPDQPKIICMGNNPDRQSIYGTALALYTSRLFKVINHKKNAAGKRNLPCGVLLDELPTIFIKGLDNLIATARSNRVAIFLGCQDKSQLERDYEGKEAEVIFNTVGSLYSGQVNGKSAKEFAETFGREFREQLSETTGGQNDTVSSSYQQQDILPQSRIETLPQGYFFGKVADDVTAPIKNKLFCAKVLVDVKARDAEEAAFEPLPKFGAKYFDEEAVAKEVRKDADKEIMAFIQEKIKTELEKKMINNPEIQYTEDEFDYFANVEFDNLKKEENREEYEKTLDEVVILRQKQMVERIIMDNYKRIKNQIEKLIEEEGAVFMENDEDDEDDEGDDEGMSAEEVQSMLN